MAFIDLKSVGRKWEVPSNLKEERAHEFRENYFLAADGFSLSPYEFRQCVQRYNGNFKIKSFSCWDQFLCIAFAQLTFRESLRDIQVVNGVASRLSTTKTKNRATQISIELEL
jgi:Domain of unknown function (DUF4372)